MASSHAEAVENVETFKEAFDKLDAEVSRVPDLRRRWERQEQEALRNRQSNIEAMDIFEAKIPQSQCRPSALSPPS